MVRGRRDDHPPNHTHHPPFEFTWPRFWGRIPCLWFAPSPSRSAFLQRLTIVVKTAGPAVVFPSLTPSECCSRSAPPDHGPSKPPHHRRTQLAMWPPYMERGFIPPNRVFFRADRTFGASILLVGSALVAVRVLRAITKTVFRQLDHLPQRGGDPSPRRATSGVPVSPCEESLVLPSGKTATGRAALLADRSQVQWTPGSPTCLRATVLFERRPEIAAGPPSIGGCCLLTAAYGPVVGAPAFRAIDLLCHGPSRAHLLPSVDNSNGFFSSSSWARWDPVLPRRSLFTNDEFPQARAAEAH